MIWTLHDVANDVIFPISDGASRIYRAAGNLRMSMQQSTQVSQPVRGAWPKAFPEHATRVLRFDISVTFPPCASYDEADMQAQDVPLQCPRGGVLTRQSGSALRTYSKAWIDNVSAENMGVTNVFTFSVSAINPTIKTLSPLAQMDPRYPWNKLTIVSLAGPGETSLAGQVTTDVAVGALIITYPFFGELQLKKEFQLIASTAAQNTDTQAGALVVHPLDYDPENPKVWIEL